MVEVCQKSKDDFLFGVCYRPPNAAVEYSLKLRWRSINWPICVVLNPSGDQNRVTQERFDK